MLLSLPLANFLVTHCHKTVEEIMLIKISFPEFSTACFLIVLICLPAHCRTTDFVLSFYDKM